MRYAVLATVLIITGALAGCSGPGGPGGVEHPLALWWFLELSLAGLCLTVMAFLFDIMFRGQHARRAERRDERGNRIP